MHRTSYMTAGLALIVALALVRGGAAQQQQQQQQQHHPGGALAAQTPPAGTSSEDEDEEEAEQAPMVSPMPGMMGHGMMHGGMMGGMMQRHFSRLARQLGLSNDQRTQAHAVLRTHAKEVIRLQADIDTLQLDVQQLLDAEPVDVSKVKPVLQAIAVKDVELRLSHITTMQEIRKLLTPEQQQKFRTLLGSMMTGDGGMMRGMMRRGGMMGRGQKTQ